MGTFNLKKALAWASSVIVKLGEGSFQALMLTWRWARGTRACIRSRGGGCSPAWWSSSGSSWRRTDQSGVSTAASWPITAHLGREGRLLQDHHKVGDVEVSCRHHTDNAASPSLRSVTYHEVVVHNLGQDGEKGAKLWRGSKINILFYRRLCLPRTICSYTRCTGVIDNFTGGQENCDKMFKRNRGECLYLNGILW